VLAHFRCTHRWTTGIDRSPHVWPANKPLDGGGSHWNASLGHLSLFGVSVKLYAPPFRRLAWQGNMSSGGVTICYLVVWSCKTGICPAGKLYSPTSTATLKNRQACLFREYVHSHCFVSLKVEGLYSSVAVRVSTCYHWSEWAGSHDHGHLWCSSGFVWFSHMPSYHSQIFAQWTSTNGWWQYSKRDFSGTKSMQAKYKFILRRQRKRTKIYFCPYQDWRSAGGPIAQK